MDSFDFKQSIIALSFMINSNNLTEKMLSKFISFLHEGSITERYLEKEIDFETKLRLVTLLDKLDSNILIKQSDIQIVEELKDRVYDIVKNCI